jgi:RNA polymerase sigma-70 factor (ECF subfamily)
VVRDVVIQAQQGDREAFATLARAHGDQLFGIARRLLRDHDQAEDAVQQTLVTAWRELPRLRDADRFGAWVQRTLIRTCYAELARARRRSITIREVPLAGVQGDGAIGLADRDQLERGFRRLPQDQRAILVLRHYLGLEPSEIAERLGIPAGTVRSRLHYAHQAMRAALEADERAAVAEGRVR